MGLYSPCEKFHTPQKMIVNSGCLEISAAQKGKIKCQITLPSLSGHMDMGSAIIHVQMYWQL